MRDNNEGSSDVVVDEYKLQSRFAKVDLLNLEKDLKVKEGKRKELMGLYIVAAKRLYELRRNVPSWYVLVGEKLHRPHGIVWLRDPKGPILTGQNMIGHIYWFQNKMRQQFEPH